MSGKKVFIEGLNDAEISTLTEGWKNGKSHAFRNRCQCVLLSFRGYDVESLCQIFSKNKNTIYEWLRNWNKSGILGIITTPGQGRKPILSMDNAQHVKIIEAAVKNAAETGANMTDEVQQKLDLEGGFSQRTLRRFLQKKSTLTRDFVDFPKNNPTSKN